MPDAPAKLWLRQAESDFHTAESLFASIDEPGYCQVISKCQQAVEKALKGEIAALRLEGILPSGPSYSHDLVREIEALCRLPIKRRSKDIASKVSSFLRLQIRRDVLELAGLAPQRPVPGGLQPRNVEYPFQRSDGRWIAPCDSAAFTLAEVQASLVIARKVLKHADGIVALIEHTPR